MAKVVVKAKQKKIKRKFAVEIMAPEFLGKISLGKSNVTDLDSVIGKTAKINLMYITQNMKNQNIRLTFKVNEINSGLAKTFVSTYEQIPYYLSRTLKAGVTLIEDSFEIKSKNSIIKVKPFVITKFQTSVEIVRSIRAKIRELLTNEIKNKSVEDFISSVINGRIQVQLRNDLKKTFPIKSFEFRKIEVK